jgi:DNA-binding transcriptional LysR family regulator
MVGPDPLARVSVFVAAARAGSFTLAAERLGLTKSAVGKAIARLEARLGIALFHRSTRVTRLTADGEAYLAACAGAIDEVIAAQAALVSNGIALSGRIHIDMPVAFGRQVLLPILAGIADEHPALAFDLTFTDATSHLLQEDVDLAVRFGAMRDSAQLIARHLATQERVICASPAYLARAGTPRDVAAVAAHRCIVGTAKGPPLSWTLRDAGGERRLIPPGTHRLSDGAAMVDAAIAGLGLVQLPVPLVRAAIEDGRLVTVLEELSAPVEVHLAWPRKAQLRQRVRHVIDRLIAAAADGALT